MVEIIRTLPSFPRGIPGLKVEYPFWDSIPTIDTKNINGVYRGDILFFDYNSRVDEDKMINVNPMIIFEGIDRNGNIIGTNLMFFNTFIDPKTSKKSINRNEVLPVINTLKALHFDEVYKTGKRQSFIKFERNNYYKIFGAKTGFFLNSFWRVYDIKKMTNVLDLNPDSALSIISVTYPKFVKSKLYIR